MLQPKHKEWLNGYKTWPVYAAYKRHTSGLKDREKVRECKKVFHVNWNLKKAWVPIFISDKTDFNIKTAIRDKEGYYIMIKESIQGKVITIVNIYAPTIEAPKYIKKILTGGPKMAEE